MKDQKNKPLWTPSADRLNNSEMTKFVTSLSNTYGLSIKNYETLHAWTVAHSDQFWSHIWEYFEIKGSKGDAIVKNKHMMPGASWFPNATLNFAENLLKYAEKTPEAIALVEVGEHKRREEISYKELAKKVAYFGEYLRRSGIRSGDVVAGILPNSQYAVIAMLATSSIGAIWTSCSPDFGVNGILDRFSQTTPKLLVACDGYYYGDKTHNCLEKVGLITEKLDNLEKAVIVNYLNKTDQPPLPSGFDKWTDILCSAKEHDNSGDIREEYPKYNQSGFDHPLYILYSSGTTGKPKCIVHGAGGTLLQHIKELALHTNIKPETKFFYYTTCGWMMWNWLVSGLSVGATLYLYDGSPFHPQQTTLYDLIDNEEINVFGASAKYYSASEKFGLQPKTTHTLESLDTVLSTGSPLSPESYDFLYQNVKSDLCVSSISGGTDIISCFTLGNPNLPVYRGELQCIGLGMDVHFVDDKGQSLPEGKGELVCKTPFPSMPIEFWNDPGQTKYKAAYFESFNNIWAHGDYGELKRHESPVQTCVIIHGRSDAVLNPGGVRIGTAEIYRQVEKIEEVFESIAVGQKWLDDVRIVLFVRLKNECELTESLVNKIKKEIRDNTTPRHVPAKIIQVSDIPRTLSGKIVELAVRNTIHGDGVNNTEALANPEALKLYRDLPELKT